VSTLENVAWFPVSTAWLWAIAATVTAVIGLRASTRVAADNERIVVLRQDRPHHVQGRGQVLLGPVLLVSVLDLGVFEYVAAQGAGHRCVRGTTCDGGPIPVELSLRYRVIDPARAVTVRADAGVAVLALVERAAEQRLRPTELSRTAAGPVGRGCPGCYWTWQSALVVLIGFLEPGKGEFELQPTGGRVNGLR